MSGSRFGSLSGARGDEDSGLLLSNNSQVTRIQHIELVAATLAAGIIASGKSAYASDAKGATQAFKDVRELLE